MANKIIIPKDIFNKIISDYNSGISILKLSKKYSYSREVISRTFKENSVEIRHNDFYAKKYQCDSNYFNFVGTEDKAYWLGFIYADGFLVKKPNCTNNLYKLGISLMASDKTHLEKMNQCMKSNNPIHIYEVVSGYKMGAKYCRLLIDDKNIVDNLIRLGVKPHKTCSNQYPNIKIINKNLIRHFIRGYFDGNGSIRISHQKNKEYFKLGINGTKEFLLAIKTYLPIDSITGLYQRFPERNKNNYDIEIYKINDIRKVLNYLYKDCNIYLDRKYERYLKFIDDFGGGE